MATTKGPLTFLRASALASFLLLNAYGCQGNETLTKIPPPDNSGSGGVTDTGGSGGSVATGVPIATGGSVGAGGSAIGGVGGSATGVPGYPLVSSATGFVQDAVTGVVGGWYAFGDAVGPAVNATSNDFADSDCAQGGFTADQCSAISTPTPGQPFVPMDLATSEMCTSGTAAQVLLGTDGTLDYADLWGAGIGLDFNNPGGDESTRSPMDLSGYEGIAFDFSGTAIPAAAIRVSFPFLGQHGGDAPYWMGATMEGSPLTPGHFEIDWSDVGGPLYLTQITPPVAPPAFDPTHIQSIQFQVFTNAVTTTPYAFCVSNLALIPRPPILLLASPAE